jgi:hypothetical protein
MPNIKHLGLLFFAAGVSVVAQERLIMPVHAEEGLSSEDVERRQKHLLEQGPEEFLLPSYPRFRPHPFKDDQIETNSPVRFGQHFREYDADSKAEQNDDVTTGVAMMGAGVISFAAALKLKRMSEITAVRLLHARDFETNRARRFLQKIKSSKLPSRFFIGSGLYLIADGTTGAVVAAYGNKPVYFVNNIGLAAYLARKGEERLDPSPANLQKIEEIKNTILGGHE